MAGPGTHGCERVEGGRCVVGALGSKGPLWDSPCPRARPGQAEECDIRPGLIVSVTCISREVDWKWSC